MHLNLSRDLALACGMMLATALPFPASVQAQTATDMPAPTIPAPAGETSGTSGTDASSAAPASLPEGVTPEMMAEGEKLFMKNCRKCHGMRGKAGVPLSGNQNIADPAYIAAMIINGRGYMPALGEHLSDKQIALIGTFARNSWGNSFGPVTLQDVIDMR